MSMHAPAEGKDPGYAAPLLLQAFSEVQLGSKRPAASLVVAFYILPQQPSPCPPPIYLTFTSQEKQQTKTHVQDMCVHALPNSLP